MNQWRSFIEGNWQSEVNTRDFIVNNVSPYQGNAEFLEKATESTEVLWQQVMELTGKERENGGVLDMDTRTVSSITSHAPGYLNKDLEAIVGVQTDQPFKRSLQPYGGIRMAQAACNAYGYELDKEIERIFTDFRKTHNQ